MPHFESEFWELLTPSVLQVCIDDKDMEPMDSDEWMHVGTQNRTYKEDMEFGGPAFAAIKPEGTATLEVDIARGSKNRIYLDVFAAKMAFTEELESDIEEPHKKVIDATRMLKVAMRRTDDYLAAGMLRKGWDSTELVVYGALPLFSASHTTPRGQTWSNTLATPMTPSALALETMRTAAWKIPNREGTRQGIKLWKILHPVDQESIWDKILDATMDPVMGNFVIPSAVRKMKLTHMPILHWDTTTTNWCALTDVQKNYGDKGLQKNWKYKSKVDDWVDHDAGKKFYKLSMRRSQGVFDPRCVFGSQA